MRLLRGYPIRMGATGWASDALFAVVMTDGTVVDGLGRTAPERWPPATGVVQDGTPLEPSPWTDWVAGLDPAARTQVRIWADELLLSLGLRRDGF